MQLWNALSDINLVCTTPQELIKSPDFIKWLEIVLWQVKTFDKDCIVWLFKKLQNDEVLDAEEKEKLSKFVNDSKVAKKWQEFLSKLANLKTNNTSEWLSFWQFLDGIFATDWYKKVQRHISEEADRVESILNPYEWMTQFILKPNWETREIYLDNENLRVDSSNWNITSIWTIKTWKMVVKINPEKDIIEDFYSWEQYFTEKSAEREAKRLWKRLPARFSLPRQHKQISWEYWGYDEFKELSLIRAAINDRNRNIDPSEKYWEFNKCFPGYISKDLQSYNQVWYSAFIRVEWWCMEFERNWSFHTPIHFHLWWVPCTYKRKDDFLTVRLVKD